MQQTGGCVRYGHAIVPACTDAAVAALGMVPCAETYSVTGVAEDAGLRCMVNQFFAAAQQLLAAVHTALRRAKGDMTTEHKPHTHTYKGTFNKVIAPKKQNMRQEVQMVAWTLGVAAKQKTNTFTP